MVAMRGAGQPQVATRLARDAISKAPKAFDQIRPGQITRQSHAAHFFAGDMQADQGG